VVHLGHEHHVVPKHVHELYLRLGQVRQVPARHRQLAPELAAAACPSPRLPPQDVAHPLRLDRGPVICRRFRHSCRFCALAIRGHRLRGARSPPPPLRLLLHIAQRLGGLALEVPVLRSFSVSAPLLPTPPCCLSAGQQLLRVEQPVK
jgi:hypothetical protein